MYALTAEPGQGAAAPLASNGRVRALAGERSGIALIATLLVIVLVAAIVAAAVTAGMSVTRSSTADYLGTRAFYAAEAGVEHALSRIELALQDGYLSDDELAAITAPHLEGFSFSEFSVQKQGIPDTVTITDGSFAGLYALNQDILVTSRATDPTGAHSAVVIGAKAQAIPLFQFAGFANGALEAYTGARSDTWGRVHVNGDIYMATSDHHIHTLITTPGRFIRDGRVYHVPLSDINIYVERLDGTEAKVNFDSEDTPDPEQFKLKSETRLDSRIRTGAMGVDSLRLPLPPGVGPYELIRPREGSDDDAERATKFAWQADMYVTIDLGDIRGRAAVCGPTPLTDKMPTITVERPKGGPVPDDASKCLIFPFKWEAFFDWKEMEWVDAADVDLGQLRTWSSLVGSAPRIVYIEIKNPSGVEDPTKTSKSGDDHYWPALRLRNGSRLPGPLTIGSMYPLYVEGHYNNVNKQPAAVFGDRLTGLSACWVDNTSPNRYPDYTGRDACDTYQYFSIITGESEGYLGCYHDGPDPGCEPIPAGKTLAGTVQNLEDWSHPCPGRCEYRIIGSFVTFWAPHIASRWGQDPNPGYTYTPPRRNWSFDNDLLDPQNLPPGTPNVGYVLRASFRELY